MFPKSECLSVNICLWFLFFFIFTGFSFTILFLVSLAIVWLFSVSHFISFNRFIFFAVNFFTIKSWIPLIIIQSQLMKIVKIKRLIITSPIVLLSEGAIIGLINLPEIAIIGSNNSSLVTLRSIDRKDA